MGRKGTPFPHSDRYNAREKHMTIVRATNLNEKIINKGHKGLV